MRTIAANANLPLTSAKTVGDIVSHRFSPTFFENDYVKLILPFLQEADAGAACVLDDNDRLSGLLTERAILRHIFACSSDKLINSKNVRKYIEDMRVNDVMIRKPETLDDTMTIEDAAGLMLRRGYRFMPVVSRAGRDKVLGIVGERELAIHLQQLLQEAKKSEQAHKSLFWQMLREPYGSGYALEGA
jgi:CBS domain-containing protein